MSLTLFEIALEYKALADQLADTELPEDVIRDTLEAEQYPLEQKGRALIAVYRNLGAEAEAIESAAKKLEERASSIRNRQESLKRYLQAAMAISGVEKITASDYTFSAKLSRGRDRVVEVFDESVLPAKYCKVVPATSRPDKVLIKKAIAEGEDVPGAKVVKRDRLTIS